MEMVICYVDFLFSKADKSHITNYHASLLGLCSGPGEEGGGGVMPNKGLTGTCGQPGYVFWDFCLK